MFAMWINLLIVLLISCSVITCQIAVLILARGGSKGVRLKNLQTVGSISLLSRAISTARTAGFNDVTVSTDHPLIALQAIKDDVTIFRRSRISATDWAPSIWGVTEFLAVRRDITLLILIQATSPFIRPIHLQNATKLIDKPRAYDCIFTATRSHKLRWKIVRSQLIAANFNVDTRVRRQDWDGEFLETGAFYITRRPLLEAGKFQNNNCTVIEVSTLESLEVDTMEDLEVANILASSNLAKLDY